MIPVLPGGELEVLLEAAIDLAQRKVDTTSEICQRFYRRPFPYILLLQLCEPVAWSIIYLIIFISYLTIFISYLTIFISYLTIFISYLFIFII